MAALIVPLPAGDFYRRHLKRMFVAILGDSVADDDARITDCPRDGQNFELTLRKVAEHVQVVHFIAHIEERVLGIVTGRRRSDDHAGGVLAVAGNVVRGGRVTTERSEISNRIR